MAQRTEDESVERFDPSQGTRTLMATEHFVRYAWAAQLVEGKTILDAGCGTGFGSEMLADGGAARVVGIDIAPEALPDQEARRPLEFLQADIHDLPFEDGTFDLVTCFEVIEHLEERPAVIAELRRVLGPKGVLVVSSPNRSTHPAGNPYHVYEYLPEELRTEVGKQFANVAVYRQDAWLASSVLDPQDTSTADPRGPLKAAAQLAHGLDPDTQPYAIVTASDGELPTPTGYCLLGDPFEVRWWHDQQAASAEAVVEARDKAAAARRELERTKMSEAAELERVQAQAERELHDARAQTTIAAKQLLELEAKRALELEAVHDAEAKHEEAQRTLQKMQRTRLWRLGGKYWRIRDRLLRRGPS